MATLRGQSGWMALSGFLTTVPQVLTAVPAGNALLDLTAQPGQTLLGALTTDDTFTVAGVGGTYTVSPPSALYNPPVVPVWRAQNNQVLGVSFAPVAPVGGFPAGALVTVASVLMVNIRQWELTFLEDILDISAMRVPWEQRRSGLADWGGAAHGLWDYGDPGQLEMVTAMFVPGDVLGFLMLGNDELPAGAPGTYLPFLQAEPVVLPQLQIADPLLDLATVIFRFRRTVNRRLLVSSGQITTLLSDASVVLG